MNSQAMAVFEKAVSETLDHNYGVGHHENTAYGILKAADQLLEDSALEMGAGVVNGIAILLLTIYKTGKYPGKSPNATLDELTMILAAAGAKAQEDANANSTTEDTY